MDCTAFVVAFASLSILDDYLTGRFGVGGISVKEWRRDVFRTRPSSELHLCRLLLLFVGLQIVAAAAAASCTKSSLHADDEAGLAEGSGDERGRPLWGPSARRVNQSISLLTLLRTQRRRGRVQNFRHFKHVQIPDQQQQQRVAIKS